MQAQPLLAAADVDTPRLDAQLLLSWVLDARREALARDPERMLSEREGIIFQKAVELRALRRPLPYITGRAWFYGREFKVNRAVLIPRPETEDLVDAVLSCLSGMEKPMLADVGTGSGCLAVTLALERPDANVWATDISRLALLAAAKNVRRYELTERVTLAEGNLLSDLPVGLRFDIIVSNPPYVTAAERPDLQPEVAQYEPVLALSGEGNATGADGTALHQALLAQAVGRLKPNGWILLEVGQGQAGTVANTARALGYADIATRTDRGGIERIVLARRPL